MNCKLAVAGLLSLAFLCPLSAQAQHKNMFKPAPVAAASPALTAAGAGAKKEQSPPEPAAPRFPDYQIHGDYLGTVDGQAVFRYEGQYFFEPESSVAPRALRNSLRKGGPADASGSDAIKGSASRVEPLSAVPPPIPDKFNPLPRQNKLP